MNVYGQFSFLLYIYLRLYNQYEEFFNHESQSAKAVEYIVCISAGGKTLPSECPGYDT